MPPASDVEYEAFASLGSSEETGASEGGGGGGSGDDGCPMAPAKVDAAMEAVRRAVASILFIFFLRGQVG